MADGLPASRGRLADGLARFAASRLAAPVAVVLAVLFIGINEAGFHLLQEATEAREVALESRVTVTRLHRLLLRAESAQRGWLLTQRPVYREPYDGTMEEVAEALQTLRRVADRRPEQREALLAVLELGARKVTELDEVRARMDRGDREAAMALVMTDIGREQMDQIDRLARRISDAETLALAETARERDRVMRVTRVAIDLLVLACLAALFLLMRQVRQRERERQQSLALLQAERDKLGSMVDARTAELTALADHLQTVREDERSRLARELHDELGGLLTAAKLDLARIRSKLGAGAPDVTERVAHLGRTLDAGIALKRRIIEDLRPSSLDNLGLVQALAILCSEWSARTEIPVATDLHEVALPPDRALVVYRLVQEALTNIAKYAQAAHVRVSIEPMDGRARVRVEDDGRGFDAGGGGGGGSGHGLAGMRFRLQSVGGALVLRSSPGAGTAIEATVPMR